MAIEIRVPGFLRDRSAGEAVVLGSGGTVAELIADVDVAYPGFAAALLDDSGLRRYVNIYVGASDIRYGHGLGTSLSDGDVVTILPTRPGLG